MEFSFLAGSAMLTEDRDGILIVSLKSGENVTICNYGFTDQYASTACNHMGYSLKGISILAKKPSLAQNMKMVLLKCNVMEFNLKSCTLVTNEEILLNCRAKSRVAHVLCLGRKIKPNVQKMSSFTQCNINNDKRLRFLPLKGKLNTGFLQIKESDFHNFRFVCNNYLNFGLPQARLFCNLLCQNPLNPRPLMFMNPGQINVEDGYFRNMTCPDYATTINECSYVTESVRCSKVFNVALRCGNEIKKSEPRPNVVCSNRSMIIEWTTKQTFYINSTLVSLHPNHTKGCLYTRRGSTKNIIIKIPLDYCNPIITDSEDSIIFKYILNRQYVGDGLVQFKSIESIEVYCEINKSNEIAREYIHGSITYPPLQSSTSLRVTMTLHTDSDFETLLPKPYNIQFYEPVYAKVTLYDTLNQVKLSLSNCFVTSATSISDINSKNSAKIIDENCPVEKYGVEITSVNKWSIAFQFTSFKIVESTTASINIFCETIKCLIIDDTECGICRTQSLRKKRSINTVKADMIRSGPIFFN